MGQDGAPAAKRGRTTWRCGEATAILGREEGPDGTLQPPLKPPTSNEPQDNRLTANSKEDSIWTAILVGGLTVH